MNKLFFFKNLSSVKLIITQINGLKAVTTPSLFQCWITQLRYQGIVNQISRRRTFNTLYEVTRHLHAINAYPLKLIRVKYSSWLVNCLDITDIDQGIEEIVNKQCLREAPLIHLLVIDGHVLPVLTQYTTVYIKSQLIDDMNHV